MVWNFEEEDNSRGDRRVTGKAIFAGPAEKGAGWTLISRPAEFPDHTQQQSLQIVYSALLAEFFRQLCGS